MISHLQAASGPVESIATLLALRHCIAPLTLSTDTTDEEIDLDIAAGAPRALPQCPLAG
ncbi:hypothetical protein [Streptomyces sp. NPDC048644]|uniref:hypothetical protein n=1 Tax=Streptomyces sp. NPDC048644 TaxID=3365582 RepID=UPI003716A44D